MKHSLIRQHIVETASDLFYRQGYNLTGINEIIAQAGIAKATLYSHFKSKDDICLAYLQFLNTAFLKDIAAVARKKEHGKAQILGLFDFLKEFYKSKTFNGCWCIRTAAEIPLENERIRTEIHQLKVNFIALITQLVTVNFPEKSDTSSEQLARQIYVLYEGAVAESHLHGEEWPINAARAICETILV